MPDTKITELSPPEGGELGSFAASLAGVAGSEPEQAAVIRMPTDKETRLECCAALSSSNSTVEGRASQRSWSVYPSHSSTDVSTLTDESTPREY